MTTIRRYEIMGVTFESCHDERGRATLAPAQLANGERIATLADRIFEEHYAGRFDALPAVITVEATHDTERVAVTPLGAEHQARWNELRASWKQQTGIDPGDRVAVLTATGSEEIGLAPWAVLRALFDELTRDRLSPEVWLLCREGHFATGGDGDVERIRALTIARDPLRPTLEPGAVFSDETQVAYADFVAQLHQAGFFENDDLTAHRRRYVARLRDALLPLFDAAQAVGDRPVSLLWYLHPPEPDLDACLAAFAALEIPDGLHHVAEVEIHGDAVSLEIRREDGVHPVLVSARFTT